jgi:hypothetical protein
MSQLSRVTNTDGLTVEQQGNLSYALTVLRKQGGLRGWAQYRSPSTGTPRTLRLLKKRRGKIEQVWNLW